MNNKSDKFLYYKKIEFKITFDVGVVFDYNFNIELILKWLMNIYI